MNDNRRDKGSGQGSSISDMERIQQGLEEFLQREMAGETGRRQPGLQIFTLDEEQENEREIDIIGSTRKGTVSQNMRQEEYTEDWDSRQPPSRRRSRPTEQPQSRRRSQSPEPPQSGRRSRPTEQPQSRRRSRSSEQPQSRRRSRSSEQPQSRRRSRSPEPPQNRRGKRRKQEKGGKKKFRIRSFLLKVALVILLLALGLYYVVGLVYSKLNYREIESVASEPMKEDGVINILLIGNDSRQNGEDGRSDAMILLSISSKTKKICMTSLLRDMYVDIPGHDKNRLNAAYSYGGAELLMETVEENLDIKVNRYVLVNFEAFANLVDAVGGVDLELTTGELELVNGYLNEYNELTGKEFGTDYMDTSKEGMVHLNGPQALAYTRNRYIGTDFGRTERQRKVLAEVIHKLPLTVITNPKELFDGLMPNLTTNLTQWECYRLSLMAPRLFIYEMVQGSIPLEGTYRDATIRKMAVLEVDFEVNKDYLEELLFGLED